MDRCLPPRQQARGNPLLVGRPHPLVPANDLRIAVQAIGDEIHDVFLGCLIHKGPHRVKPLEQMCISISNVLQFCALEDVCSASDIIDPPNRADEPVDLPIRSVTCGKSLGRLFCMLVLLRGLVSKHLTDASISAP